ncbi:MAG: hypothetical protein ABI645_11800 [Pseudomonadota bacterium]
MLRSLSRLAGTALLCALSAGAARAATQVLVIAGRGGEAQFDTRFGQWSQKVATASTSVTGDPERVTRLAGPDAKLAAVQKALESAAQTLRAGDQFVLVLMGHGSSDGSEYRYMLWGNDITGTDLGALLDKIPSNVQQLVINATSASGAIAEKWARPYRVVITATKSAGERNAPKFGGYWADALASNEADRDKDGNLTAQEAYDFANRKVADAFKSDAAIVTEHARISGTDPAHFVVARIGAAAMFASDTQLIALRNEQGVIESRLAELRVQKAQLAQDEYFNRIEPVLVELAKVGERVDARLAALGMRTGEAANGAR